MSWCKPAANCPSCSAGAPPSSSSNHPRMAHLQLEAAPTCTPPLTTCQNKGNPSLVDTRPLHIAKISLASNSMFVKRTCCGGGSSHMAGIPQEQYLMHRTTIPIHNPSEYIIALLNRSVSPCQNQQVLLQLLHLSTCASWSAVCKCIITEKNS